MLLFFLFFYLKDFSFTCIMIMVSEAFRFVICSAVFYPFIQGSRWGEKILLDAAQSKPINYYNQGVLTKLSN